MTNFETDLLRFDEFVSKESFANAKTYEKTAPHEYIVCKPDDKNSSRRSEFGNCLLTRSNIKFMNKQRQGKFQHLD